MNFDFELIYDAQETYDIRTWPDHHAQALEDQPQLSDQYYCGLCGSFQSLTSPCVHHPGVEVK